MAIIDSNNFITHLVWSGLVDKATCGELKEAIELCTVKVIYTKDDIVTMFTELQDEIHKMPTIDICIHAIDNCVDRFKIENLIQDRIDKLIGDGNEE